MKGWGFSPLDSQRKIRWIPGSLKGVSISSSGVAGLLLMNELKPFSPGTKSFSYCTDCFLMRGCVSHHVGP